jgi:NAD(P)-dependent dehydrogenase (short-subunit alcohol dehydrogenase family)
MHEARVTISREAMVETTGKLDGRVGLVTGAAKRIGRSIALALAREGADVVVNYATSAREAEALVGEIRGLGRRGMAYRADVSNRGEVEGMFAAVVKEFGRVDVLVNNAGMFSGAKFMELTDEEWDKMLDVNLKSQFLCAQAAAKIMLGQGSGRIVNISSLGGLQAWPSYVHYCVSKAGVIELTKCLARALAPGILVNSVAPGTIQFEGEEPDKNAIRRTPLERTGTGEEIAEAVVFLAETKFITGQVIAVDGGRLLS